MSQQKELGVCGMYTRWGASTCPTCLSGTQLVYAGRTGGMIHTTFRPLGGVNTFIIHLVHEFNLRNPQYSSTQIHWSMG